jgi:hypothetical protein
MEWGCHNYTSVIQLTNQKSLVIATFNKVLRLQSSLAATKSDLNSTKRCEPPD